MMMDHQTGLCGKRILVTRATSFINSENELTRLLQQKGATVCEKPLLSIDPPSSFEDLDNALKQFDTFDWIVFASPRAVSSVLERIRTLFDLQTAEEIYAIFKKVKVAAVGKSTANFLKDQNIEVHFHPSDYCAEGLVKEFPKNDLAGKKIFWPRTLKGELTINDGLKALGAEVFMAEAYSSNLPKSSEVLSAELEQIMRQEVDVITFTSSQTVRNFVSIFNLEQGKKLSDLYASVIVACIGPKTAKTALDIYGKADVVAGEYTIEGLVKSLERFLQPS